MRLFRNLDDLPEKLRGGAVTIGNFDGVHRGHARIVERLLVAARRVGGPATVLTFDPHPVRLLRPEAVPPPLTWTNRKAALLADIGVDAIVAYPTDEAMLALSPDVFFQSIILDGLGARAIVEGPNFYFGRDRSGDVDLLGELCRQASVLFEVVQPLEVGGKVVSSSRIRLLISRGRVEEAAAMLTRPYRIRGMVTHGAGRGAKIGFATANIDAIDTLLPAPAVYAGRVHVEENTWPAAINIGPNPTFGENVLKVEAHLIGFDGSLYGQPLEVDFLARLRDIHPFDSPRQLEQQLTRDVQAAKKIADL